MKLFSKIYSSKPKHTIKKFRLTQYEEITIVADYLKSGASIILDLSQMQDNKYRRCIDFMAGVLYSVDGKIERTGEPGSKMYLLTPDKIIVDEEYRKTMMDLDLEKV